MYIVSLNEEETTVIYLHITLRITHHLSQDAFRPLCQSPYTDTLFPPPQCPGVLHRNIPWGILSHQDVNPYNPYDPQHLLVCPSLYRLLSLRNCKIHVQLSTASNKRSTLQITALCINQYTCILELHIHYQLLIKRKS